MKTAKKANRKAVPFEQIQKLWNAGKSYIEIAKAIGRYKKDAETEDIATKPTRAIVSLMLNGKATAWKDKSGKVCKLQPRDGMRNIGAGRKMHRSPKKATKKAVTKKSTAPKVDGKTAAAQGHK
jgi:hypothetical protein